jgi:hypothetical protein
MFLHNATHRWQKRRLQAAAPTHAQRSGGLEPPNAGKRTSIECRTIRHTRIERSQIAPRLSQSPHIMGIHSRPSYGILDQVPKPDSCWYTPDTQGQRMDCPRPSSLSGMTHYGCASIQPIRLPGLASGTHFSFLPGNIHTSAIDPE